MFDFSGRSRRSSLTEMMRSIPEPAMFTSVPVLREQCGCGGFTEAVAYDESRTEAYFAKWRKEHQCKSPGTQA